jgi:hypothetical protein
MVAPAVTRAGTAVSQAMAATRPSRIAPRPRAWAVAVDAQVAMAVAVSVAMVLPDLPAVTVASVA